MSFSKLRISTRQKRSVTLERRVGELPGWHFTLRCRTCRRGRQVPMAGLPAHRTVAEVMDRLVCDTCGQPPQRAAVSNGLAGFRGWTVKLTDRSSGSG